MTKRHTTTLIVAGAPPQNRRLGWRATVRFWRHGRSINPMCFQGEWRVTTLHSRHIVSMSLAELSLGEVLASSCSPPFRPAAPLYHNRAHP
jgi:hypothetical protein